MEKTQAGGRELHFYWDLQAWFDVEEKIGSIDVLARRINSDGEQPAQASAVLIEATANAGYRRLGSRDRIDQKWILETLGCKAFKRLNALARRAFIEGMRRENAQDEDEPVDVVAQEIKKNETQGEA